MSRYRPDHRVPTLPPRRRERPSGDGAALSERPHRLRAGRARVGIEVVDIAGRIKSGELKRGANPVGVTLELLIEPMEDRR